MKFEHGCGGGRLNLWINIFLFLILNLTTWSAVFAAESRVGSLPSDEVVRRVQAAYDAALQIKANFDQQLTIKAGGQRQNASGKVYIKKPGMMRWEYEKPDKRLVVSDGKTIWMYLPSKNQVMITEPAEAAMDEISKIFLMGKGKLVENFDVRLLDSVEGADGKSYTLELVPKSKAGSFVKLILEVDGDSFFFRKGTTYDLFGNENQMTFQNVELGAPLDERQFTFEIPPGAEVIRQSAAPFAN